MSLTLPVTRSKRHMITPAGRTFKTKEVGFTDYADHLCKMLWILRICTVPKPQLDKFIEKDPSAAIKCKSNTSCLESLCATIFLESGRELEGNISACFPCFSIHPLLTTVRNRMQCSTSPWSASVKPVLHSYVMLYYWIGSQNYCKDTLWLRKTKGWRTFLRPISWCNLVLHWSGILYHNKLQVWTTTLKS